jgi:uncharacterized membrane protein
MPHHYKFFKNIIRKKSKIIHKMWCPALGVWVAFLTAWCTAWTSAFNKIKINIFELLLIHLWFFIFYFFEFVFNLFFVWDASPGSAGCFKNATQTPNAVHIYKIQKKCISKKF